LLIRLLEILSLIRPVFYFALETAKPLIEPVTQAITTAISR
jgi:hypothetical protein